MSVSQAKKVMKQATQVVVAAKEASKTSQDRGLEKRVEFLENSIQEAQMYLSEDSESISDLMEKQKALTLLVESIFQSLQEIQQSVEQLTHQERLEGLDEDLIRFLGIEAPKSKWVQIAKMVAAALATAGALYLGYRYLNQSPDKPKNDGTVML